MALVNKQPVLYFQTDPRWANISYSAKGESTTIGRAGCGPTSMAMVLATWADPSVTPKTECAWALKNGYKAPHKGTYYSYFVPAAKRYGLTCYQVNSARIYGNANSTAHTIAKNAVDNGDLVIACMGEGLWTSSGHYIVVYGIEGNMVYINDSASSKIARTHGNYLVFKQQVKYYWVIKRPANIPIGETITYTDADYTVKNMDQSGLNCRSGPGLSYQVMKVYPFESEIHISQTTDTGWGKTDAGWINLKNTERVKDLTESETRKLVASMLDNGFKTFGDQISEALKTVRPKVYNTEAEIPEWYRGAFLKVKPVLEGTGSGLGLSEDLLRTLTLLDRLGILQN